MFFFVSDLYVKKIENKLNPVCNDLKTNKLYAYDMKNENGRFDLAFIKK